ncbi:MAG: HD domain-containing protein [Ruminococcus sp.]|nr:HD domain-containing protein [Ruminococcus sp.]
MEKSRLEKQFEFCLEVDKEKSIKRQTLQSDGITKENDAEHAWHMALMSLLLSEYSNEEIDLLKTISMILIHDVVEVDAGDTYAYDEVSKQTQREREEKAADRIFGLLPDDQGEKFRALWEEFEAGETPEAKFARTMDNIQPTMLNNATDGQMWLKNKVKLSQILSRNKNTPKGSQKLWEYSYNNFIQPNVEKGRIIED